jgi:lysozyme
VYASESWFSNQLSYAAVSGYTVWNAHYGVSASGINCHIWQYTSNGTVPGIGTRVDLDISYMG